MSRVELQLPQQVSSAGLARRHTRRMLDARGRADLGEVAALIVSELVTNAVWYGHAPIVLALDLDGRLRIEVTDAGARIDTVTVQRNDPAAPTGRGLQLVDTLARTWGVTAYPGGKTVWAELP